MHACAISFLPSLFWCLKTTVKYIYIFFPDDFRLTAQEEELKAKEALRKVKVEEEKKQRSKGKEAGKKKAFFLVKFMNIRSRYLRDSYGW